MKRILLFNAMVLSSLLSGQVTIQNNIPPVIESNAEITLQVKISKGAIAGFSKYQLDVPPGVNLKEGDSKGGTFTFEENKASIIWSSAPPDSVFSISIKLSTGAFEGVADINQKFSFMENGERKEIAVPSMNVTFKGDGSKNTTNLDGPGSDGNKTPKNKEQLQAEQLKKDSKEAYKTGLKEQKAADQKLADADVALKNAQNINDEEEKKVAVQKAATAKQKAENDKAVASKILALAKSLDENAAEIERLNKAAEAGKGTAGNASTPSSARPSSNPNTSGSSSSSSNTGSSASIPDNGTVYRLQLGAFAQNPEKVLYKHLGTINIVNENGMYKVLMGKYATREDAVKRRDELTARSFDCFIVTYKDGVRVK